MGIEACCVFVLTLLSYVFIGSYDRVLSIEGHAWEAASASDKLLGSLPRTRKQTMVGSPSYQMDPEWNVPREKICIMKVRTQNPTCQCFLINRPFER